MNILVDTSVWSLAFRRDSGSGSAEVEALATYLRGDGSVITSGLIVQELLQGFQGPRQARLIMNRLSSLPFIVPSLTDHVEAASLRNTCGRHGLQVGTIDALLAQLCIGQGLELLTTDRDFQGIARFSALRLVKVR